MHLHKLIISPGIWKGLVHIIVFSLDASVNYKPCVRCTLSWASSGIKDGMFSKVIFFFGSKLSFFQSHNKNPMLDSQNVLRSRIYACKENTTIWNVNI